MLILKGLDGSVPVDFLASLGALYVTSRDTEVSLSWEADGVSYTPRLHGISTAEQLLDSCIRAKSLFESGIGTLRYLKKEKVVRQLQPPVGVLRPWLQRQIAQEKWDSLRLAAGLFCETATEKEKEEGVSLFSYQKQGIEVDVRYSDKVCQTFFDFTCRNEQFLDQVTSLGTKTLLEHVAALVDNQPLSLHGTTLHWELSAGASSIVSGTKLRTRPFVEWLAVWGLCLLPVGSHNAKAVTTSCTGKHKDAVFAWPIWEDPLGESVVRSLLASSFSSACVDRGLLTVFSSPMKKADDGYAGVFLPAQPV